MKKTEYELIENYMLSCMSDSAHDKEHIYRVLYVALDIAKYESDVCYDVLITACLLHDIGRNEESENPKLCHAIVGAQKAYIFLTEHGYSDDFAKKVASCIRAHRFRASAKPETIEEKILFDADKVDVTGAIGIARTIFHGGQLGEPLYSLNENGEISDGTNDSESTFFQEYKFKLENIYSVFYTKRGAEIALDRQNAAKTFYQSLLNEVRESHKLGRDIIYKILK